MNLFNLYSKLPIWLQQLLVSLYSYKVEKERFGGEFDSLYKQLLESDNWSKQEVVKYKEENLFRIIDHAYRHCPFYKKLYDAHGVKPSDFTCLKDLDKFPILTKEMVRNNLKDLVADNFDKKDLISYHTSGSTGTPLDFYWTKHNLQYYWAIVQRGRKRFGIDKGDKHINFTGKIVVPLAQNKPPYWRYRSAQRQAMVNMQHLTKEKVPFIADYINRENFRFIVGYPSIVYEFARIVNELGIEIKAVPEYYFSGAEKLYENQKEEIETAFPGIICVEHYGFSENVASASKVAGCEGYYEDFELGLLEVKASASNGETETGPLLATGFQNYGMPFIRYQIGDIATLNVEKDGVRQILDIEGRSEDFILTPEGTQITRFDYIFKSIKDIKECQVVQRELGKVVLRVVRRDSYDRKATEEILRATIKEFISPLLEVSFEYVDEIERTMSGKFRAVVSEIHQKSN